jgi:hypothetical protein
LNTEGLFPLEAVLCGRCSTACDQDDNFCRKCGLPMHDNAQLPALRRSGLPAVWRPPVPAVVVKSAAFVAAGTLAELIVRRLVRNALKRDAADALPRAAAKANGQIHEDSQLVSETYLLRRVRLRR